MELTREENDMLEGRCGYPAQKSMEMLVALGECFDAARMVPVSSAHLLNSAVAMGKGGVLFFQEMADKGGHFVINTDTNPSIAEPDVLKRCSDGDRILQQQQTLAGLMTRLGALRGDTCAPYLVGNVPRKGEHVAWNESSAISFANSVLGARTNREGGPSAFAAAITGRVPEYGYHLDENRHGDMKVVVTTPLKDPYDYGTLGYFTGKFAQDGVPVFVGIQHPVSWDDLKVLGAAAATSGSVALYHVAGVTPEAPDEATAFGGGKPKDSRTLVFGEKEFRETEESLTTGEAKEVQLVLVGCPHYSIYQLREMAHLLSGRRLKSGTELWIGTTRMVRAYGEIMGYVGAIEAAGAKFLCGTCPVTLYRELIKNNGPRVIATDSPKLANGIGVYNDRHQDVTVHYGDIESCVGAAISGTWRQ